MSTARAFVYLPHVLGGAASIVIWSWLLNPQFGWINHGIRLIYIALDPFVHLLDPRGTQDWPTPRWLYSADSCKPAVILIHVWTIGGSMLVFLAGLRRVPAYLYEAARVDGAGGWARFRNVTWPQLTPILLFNGVVSCVFAMQCFNEAYLLQNRQQDDGLLFYALYVYQSAFEPPYRLGFASALGWILFVLMLFMVSAIGCSSRWWVSYSGVEIHKRS
jgi:multiple sugar transport system permease protein